MAKIALAFAIFLTSCVIAPIPMDPNTATLSSSPTSTEILENSIEELAAWWQPLPGESWQIQFTGESIDTNLDVEIYDLDLFDTPPELIDKIHAQDKHVICYLNAGAWEDWRPDAGDFPSEILGADYEGWPGERWLDTGNLAALAPIMLARLDLCTEKGFDGVDPDNLDGFTNETGFDLAPEEAIAYAQWLAAEAHSRGLAIGLKNAPELVPELEPYFDWALVESCFAQGWCEQVVPFIAKGKPVFAIEYIEDGVEMEDFCGQAAELGFSAILKNRELDDWVEHCE